LPEPSLFPPHAPTASHTLTHPGEAAGGAGAQGGAGEEAQRLCEAELHVVELGLVEKRGARHADFWPQALTVELRVIKELPRRVPRVVREDDAEAGGRGVCICVDGGSGLEEEEAGRGALSGRRIAGGGAIEVSFSVDSWGWKQAGWQHTHTHAHTHTRTMLKRGSMVPCFSAFSSVPNRLLISSAKTTWIRSWVGMAESR
jgi:hypothetical protein